MHMVQAPLSISFCYLTSLQVHFHSMHQSLFQFPLCPALDFIYPNSCQCEVEVCSPLPCTSAFSDKQMDLSVSLYANRHGVSLENRQRADTWGASQAVSLTKVAGNVFTDCGRCKKYLQVTFPKHSYQHTFTFFHNCIGYLSRTAKMSLLCHIETPL